GDAHGAGDPVNGDVVVRGPDPAGGEHVVIGAALGGDLVRDWLDLVRNDDEPPHVDAQPTELPTEIDGVRVGDLAREDLVADEQDAGRLRHDSRNSTISVGRCRGDAPREPREPRDAGWVLPAG